MKSAAYRALAFGPFFSLFLTVAARSQTFLPGDATIDYAISGDVYAGFASSADFLATPRRSPTSPAIRIVAQGSISDSLRVYNRSAVTISGGSIYYADAYDSSVINLFDGGHIGNAVFASSTSVINMSGGDLQNANIYASDASVVNISGGVLRTPLALNNSVLNVSGGTMASLYGENDSAVHITGGVISNGMTVFDSSVITISGGNINNNLLAYNQGVVNILGGASPDLYAADSSLINLYGAGLSGTLVNAHYRDNFGNEDSLYAVSGLLRDGTILSGKNIYIRNGSGARFTLNNSAAVPEPGSTLAAALGAAFSTGFLLRRRKSAPRIRLFSAAGPAAASAASWTGRER